MASNEDKAADWFEKATKLKNQKKIGPFGGPKFEEAAEAFGKAANLYKIAKKWDQAGKAFTAMAECHIGLKSNYEAATAYVDAGNCFKKGNKNDAVTSLQRAIELFMDEGKFSIAAKHEKDLAELFEEDYNYEQAVEHFQKAADLFDGESATSQSNNCLQKVAQYSAKLEKFDVAAALFEQIAKASIGNNLLKWGVKEHLLKAGLCHLAIDLVAAKRSLEQYQDLDPTFTSQREFKFLQDLVAAVENYDVESFTEAVVEYDSISKLDEWKTSVLLKIKKSIKEEEKGLA